MNKFWNKMFFLEKKIWKSSDTNITKAGKNIRCAMSLTQRYLLYLSYIGTHFRGSQAQNTPEPSPTVQSTLEENIALIFKTEKQKRYPVTLSSRTDSGVHAIKAGAHVNLPPIYGDFLQPSFIQNFLNKRFILKNIHLRVVEVKKVPDKFSARLSSLGKAYVYRLGVLKDEYADLSHMHPSPITEAERTHFPSYRINFEKAKEASQIFVGEKNFALLQKRAANYAGPTVCNIKSFDFKEAQPLMPDYDPTSSHYNYFHISIEGNRFLRHMIRRMIGMALSVGGDFISIETAKSLLENPYSAVWPPKAKIVPAHGLYLANVFYNSDHLIMTEEEEDQKKAQVEVTNFN